MATKQKLTKATKREMVVPFNDEHNFIVPKKGGFMQPDNERYVMAVGNTSKAPTTTTTTSNLPNDGSTNTTTGTNVPITSAGEPIYVPPTNTSPAEPSPNPTSGTPAPATPQQLCVAPNMWVNGQCLQGGVEQSPAELSCIASGGLWSGGINGTCITSSSPKTNTTVTDTPIVNDLPNFPNWSTLDCTTLKDKIAEYNATLSTSRFAQNIIDAYNTEIAKAQAIYNGKCNATPSTPTPPIAVIGGGGGVFGGGGGGGLGEPPSSDEVPQEEEKGKFNWLLVLAIIGGIYLLSKKSK